MPQTKRVGVVKNLGIVGRGIGDKGGVRNGADGGDSNVQNEKQKLKKYLKFDILKKTNMWF